MSDSTQQPTEQPVQQLARERAAEPAVAFLRRHGAVILVALLFLGCVLHDRPALREAIGALATAASPGIALMALTLLRPGNRPPHPRVPPSRVVGDGPGVTCR
ncbi:hypothetical protein ACFUAG_35225 [Streptomyces sp. NPDC057193]|uniref:hypothetical protein n=1 Tax=Streptomyces sp. NPDC057193 TaxID=3346043 RepID=UPI00362B722D